MSIEKITPFYLFLSHNMSIIREYGMSPTETVDKAYEIWKNMNFQDKIYYFMKCDNKNFFQADNDFSQE